MNTWNDYLNRANGLVKQRHWAEAAECFRQAIARNGECLEALRGLARLALLRKRPDEARRLLIRALAIQPGQAEALALSGLSWMQKEDFARAVEDLEKARAADPSLQMVYYNLAKSYLALKQFARSEENLGHLLRMAPRHYKALRLLGLVQVQLGWPRDGMVSMLRAVRMQHGYLEGILAAGSLYEQAGKLDGAIRLYRYALRHNPKAIVLRERLSAVYAAKLDFPAAREESLRILEERQQHGDYLRLGIYSVALERLEEAEKAFQRSIELDPRSWEGHYNLAELYMSAKLMDLARAHYESAISNSRQAAYQPLNGLGLLVLEVAHDPDRAIELLNRAQRLAPSRPEPLLNLALAYAVKRIPSEAERFAASAMKLAKPRGSVYQQAEHLLGSLRLERRIHQPLA